MGLAANAHDNGLLDHDEDRWFLRPKDLARKTGLSVSEIREAIYRGDLKAKKYRRRGWLIAVEDARTWIESECQAA
jgi:hypothetical protein